MCLKFEGLINTHLYRPVSASIIRTLVERTSESQYGAMLCFSTIFGSLVGWAMEEAVSSGPWPILHNNVYTD